MAGDYRALTIGRGASVDKEASSTAARGSSDEELKLWAIKDFGPGTQEVQSISVTWT